MKRITLVLAAFTAISLISIESDARRMGGGSGLGASRPTATPRQAQPTPPASNAAPTAPAAPSKAATPGTPASAATPPRSGMSRWLGPIAGLAAGLGLAALMSHLGLSEAFGSFLLIALLVVAAIFLVRMFLRRNVATPAAASAGMGSSAGEPFRYAEAGNTSGANSGVTIGRDVPPLSNPAFGGGSAYAASPSVPASNPVFPPGFDPQPFVQQAKASFNRLQAAYDRADMGELREFLTPDMAEQVEQEILRRGIHQPTEVVQLDADVMEVTTEADKHWASVRFSGLAREDGSAVAEPFDEVWNLTKPVSGRSGWLLAGIQQLQ